MGSGKYTGTGSPIAGAISGRPFIPALILAKPKTVPMEWRGRNAQTSTSSNAVGTPAGSHTTFITALNADGCDVGVALSTASSAGHFWLAFGYPTAAESAAGRGGIPSDIPSHLDVEFGGAQLEGSFGPVVWIEFSSPDNSMQVWAPVPLPDPASYYYGYKAPKLLSAGVIQRTLSDEQGQYSAQRFGFVVSDLDRYLATLLGADQWLLNRRVVMRLISDEQRRALGIPRTVGIGLVRGYQAQ
jgi:hypothetical protein